MAKKKTPAAKKPPAPKPPGPPPAPKPSAPPIAGADPKPTAGQKVYTVTVHKAKKGTAAFVKVICSGRLHAYKQFGFTFKFACSDEPARKVWEDLLTLKEPGITMVPVPAGVEARTTAPAAGTVPGDDTATDRAERAKLPGAGVAMQRSTEIPHTPAGAKTADPNAELEGEELGWPYDQFRPEDEILLNRLRGQRRKKRHGKQRVRLGANGDRIYRIDPVRGGEPGIEWCVRRLTATGLPEPISTGAEAHDWYEAVELLKRYEQSL